MDNANITNEDTVMSNDGDATTSTSSPLSPIIFTGIINMLGSHSGMLPVIERKDLVLSQKFLHEGDNHMLHYTTPIRTAEGFSCATEAATYALRVNKVGRYVCDNPTSDTNHPKILTCSLGDVGKEFRTHWDFACGEVDNKALPLVVPAYDDLCRGIASCSFNMVILQACGCTSPAEVSLKLIPAQHSSQTPTIFKLMTTIPFTVEQYGRVQLPPHPLKTIGQVCEFYFAQHDKPEVICEKCSKNVVMVNFVVDRLPPVLAVECPYGTWATQDGLEYTVNNTEWTMYGLDGKLAAVAGYNVRAACLCNHIHTRMVLLGGGVNAECYILDGRGLVGMRNKTSEQKVAKYPNLWELLQACKSDGDADKPWRVAYFIMTRWPLKK